MKEKNQIDHYANALYSIWFDLNANDKITFTSSAKDIYFSFKNNFVLLIICHTIHIFYNRTLTIYEILVKNKFIGSIIESPEKVIVQKY
ncbi:MAG: hypothetical protein K2J02_01795, partial [Malacoplasma sp.]|nr:hypothetical protein [Malacoplasma sp.]